MFDEEAFTALELSLINKVAEVTVGLIVSNVNISDAPVPTGLTVLPSFAVIITLAAEEVAVTSLARVQLIVNGPLALVTDVQVPAVKFALEQILPVTVLAIIQIVALALCVAALVPRYPLVVITKAPTVLLDTSIISLST